MEVYWHKEKEITAMAMGGFGLSPFMFAID